MSRHAKRCGRDWAAGPGSCWWWWWETCPEAVTDCSIRVQRRAALMAGEHARAVNLVIEEALAT